MAQQTVTLNYPDQAVDHGLVQAPPGTVNPLTKAWFAVKSVWNVLTSPTFNPFAVLTALYQLFSALKITDPVARSAAITAALQALLKAFTG